MKPPRSNSVTGPEKAVPKADKRIDIASADDVNVDEGNDVESPKNNLSASDQGPDEKSGAGKLPGDEVAADTEQTGTLPCESCNGTGRLRGEPCPQCGGSGEVVVNIGDA